MQLKVMYLAVKRMNDEMACWEISALVDELELEITEAHKGINGKMTVGKDGHPIVHIGNIITPMVPQWQPGDKGEVYV
jgi:hypothetical protein